MRIRPYQAMAGAARRFFAATGIPVPGFVRRTHRALGGAGTTVPSDVRKDLKALRREVEKLRTEVETLQLTVDRVETTAYLDSIGHEPD